MGIPAETREGKSVEREPEIAQFVASDELVPAHHWRALQAQIIQHEEPAQEDVGLLHGDR